MAPVTAVAQVEPLSTLAKMSAEALPPDRSSSCGYLPRVLVYAPVTTTIQVEQSWGRAVVDTCQSVSVGTCHYQRRHLSLLRDVVIAKVFDGCY